MFRNLFAVAIVIVSPLTSQAQTPAAPALSPLARVEADRASIAQNREIAVTIATMRARDQFLRNTLVKGMQTPGWTQAQITQYTDELGKDVAALDAENTTTLKRMLTTRSIVDIVKVGQSVASDVSLLIIHSQDMAFKAAMVAQLEPLVATGELHGSWLASTIDDLRLDANQPQRFGNRWKCIGGKHTMTGPPVSVREIERARAAWRLEPLASYRRGIERMYGKCPPA